MMRKSVVWWSLVINLKTFSLSANKLAYCWSRRARHDMSPFKDDTICYFNEHGKIRWHDMACQPEERGNYNPQGHVFGNIAFNACFDVCTLRHWPVGSPFSPVFTNRQINQGMNSLLLSLFSFQERWKITRELAYFYWVGLYVEDINI